MSAAGMFTTAASMTTATTAGVTATFTAGMTTCARRTSTATACVCCGACVSTAAEAAAASRRCTAGTSVGGCARRASPGAYCTASCAYRAASGSEPSAAAVDVTSSTGVDEAMTAPAVSVAPVGPWAYAQKDAVIEVASPIETDGRAGIGWVFVVAVTANRRRTADTDYNLGIARRGTGQRRSHCY